MKRIDITKFSIPSNVQTKGYFLFMKILHYPFHWYSNLFDVAYTGMLLSTSNFDFYSQKCCNIFKFFSLAESLNINLKTSTTKFKTSITKVQANWSKWSLVAHAWWQISLFSFQINYGISILIEKIDEFYSKNYLQKNTLYESRKCYC